MRSRLVASIPLTLALMVLLFTSSCGTTPNCPTCGTTLKEGYANINIIPVPQHNPTGEPGGPFNSFDISWIDSIAHKDYVSDRIALDVVVVDTINNIAMNAIGGDNAVSTAQPASPCDPSIPPMISAVGNLTRFGCKQMPTFSTGNFGGFPGAQCCASRGNGVNPLSCPCGIVATADGKTLFVGNSTSAVVVFDLTTSPPTVIANIPTGQPPDWNGPLGVGPCITSASGRGFDDPTCGDLRADEMSLGVVSGRSLLMVDNGDPGIPFVTVIDVTNVVGKTGTLSQQHCLPKNPAAPYSPTNPPTCILGQIFYDGLPTNSTVAPCPDPSNPPTPAGIAGVPCRHAPVAPAGLGGSTFNTNTHHFLTTLPNNGPDPSKGEVEEVDPLAAGGPRIVNTFPVSNCMPTSVVQGPDNNFLVGCANHDGVTFPPNEYIIDGTSGTILANITFVGGVDQIWFNPGDSRYYLAARDMPNGPVMGVIDAKSMQWLQNVPTNTNSHSIAVDSSNNHAFVPMQSGGPCGAQSSNGCIGVFAQQ